MSALSSAREPNQEAYNSLASVDQYASNKALQLPEKTIFQILEPRLHAMEMLDIGIGAGRTTAFIAPRVKRYVGCDYSPSMIASCKNRFSLTLPNAQLIVADARDLSQFKDQSFDLLLFSFNGIDCVDCDGRNLVLKEAFRLLRAGGVFVFSSHNMRWYIERSSFPVPTGGGCILYLKRIKRWLLLRGHNLHLSANPTESLVWIRDGSLAYRMNFAYIRPEQQLLDLARQGFSAVRFFGLADGREITTEDQLKMNSDAWIYFSCMKS